MRCKNCGAIVRDGTAFCIVCGGNEFIAEQQNNVNNVNNTYVCQFCGNTISANTTFCGACGHIVQQQNRQEAVVPPVKPKRSKGALITLIVVITLLALTAAGVVGYMAFYGDNSIGTDKEKSTSTDTAPEKPSESSGNDDGNEVITEDEDEEDDYGSMFDASDEDEDNDKSDTDTDSDVDTDTDDDRSSSEEPIEREKISTYTPQKADVTWLEANSGAISEGGHLVYIDDAEEFAEVCNIAYSNDIKVFWVGARRYTYDYWYETTWLDGENIRYTKWLSGEPSYTSEDGEECYLMVFKVGEEWYYNDATNDVSQYYQGKIGYIVEKEEYR